MSFPSCSSLKILFIILLTVSTSVTNAQQLVLRGDFPDPSVVKTGDTYWASATTSNWLPAFPLLKSKDLIHWTTESFVFEKQPGWADYYFWAPELSEDKGRFYVYYAAHKKDGNLCVGVASADRPEGPYRDHGPLICQAVGSIDAFPVRDENGKLYLVWKEDANSVGKPTPIWISEMNEERTALTGEKKELFRNSEPWEGNLVEGVSLMKHRDYYYAFYAASACCGAECNYVSGLARSKSLFGPWEKYAKNPVLVSDEKWKCPGHGTPVEKDGKYYFLHHAYGAKEGVYVGRQGFLTEFRFTDDDWIEFVKEETPPAGDIDVIKDEFRGRKLASEWQWSVFQEPAVRQRAGKLKLFARPSESGAFLGRKIFSPNFRAEAEILLKRSASEAGVAAIGDERNLVYAVARGNLLSLRVIKDNKPVFIEEHNFTPRRKLFIRMEVFNGKEICFSYSNDGKNFTRMTSENVPAAFLPPWDRAVRAGLVSRGDSSTSAVFRTFSIDNN